MVSSVFGYVNQFGNLIKATRSQKSVISKDDTRQKEHPKIALFLAEVESVAISLPAKGTPPNVKRGRKAIGTQTVPGNEAWNAARCALGEQFNLTPEQNSTRPDTQTLSKAQLMG